MPVLLPVCATRRARGRFLLLRSRASGVPRVRGGATAD